MSFLINRTPASMKKMLEKTEELSLARAWLDHGCEHSRARLLDAYQPMIRKNARKYLRNGLNLDDLIQEGNIGFLAGLDNFDPDRGYSVGTLARFHITARIQLHLSEFAGIIRLPNSRRIKGLLSKCVGKIRFEEAELGRSLSMQEKAKLCENAGFSLEELEQYEMVMRPTKSISSQSSNDDEEYGFELPDENVDTEAQVIRKQSLENARSLLVSILKNMPERTQKILTMRHLSDKFVSLDSISQEVGISRERVRRIEMDALSTIRQRLEEKGVESISDIA
jgi:RNA polymerase sigma factor (sigma-70 family)